jgi:hypothetical protein
MPEGKRAMGTHATRYDAGPSSNTTQPALFGPSQSRVTPRARCQSHQRKGAASFGAYEPHIPRSGVGNVSAVGGSRSLRSAKRQEGPPTRSGRVHRLDGVTQPAVNLCKPSSIEGGRCRPGVEAPSLDPGIEEKRRRLPERACSAATARRGVNTACESARSTSRRPIRGRRDRGP